MPLKYYRQRPVQGGRARVGASVERQIELQLRRTAKRFKVSPSWVQNEILADFFGIGLEERYESARQTRGPSPKPESQNE